MESTITTNRERNLQNAIDVMNIFKNYNIKEDKNYIYIVSSDLNLISCAVLSILISEFGWLNMTLKTDKKGFVQVVIYKNK